MGPAKEASPAPTPSKEDSPEPPKKAPSALSAWLENRGVTVGQATPPSPKEESPAQTKEESPSPAQDVVVPAKEDPPSPTKESPPDPIQESKEDSPEPALENDEMPVQGNDSAQESSSVTGTGEAEEEETEKEQQQSEDVKESNKDAEDGEKEGEAPQEEENQAGIAGDDTEGVDSSEKESSVEEVGLSEEGSPVVASQVEAAPATDEALAEVEAPAEEKAEEKVVDGSLKATALLDITVIEEQTETASDAAILEAASSTADVELEAALNEIEEIPPESVQEILQSVRDGIAEENEKEDLLKAGGSKGWCCYLILAFLVAL